MDGKAGCSEAKKEMRGAELVKWLVKSVCGPQKELREVHGGGRNFHRSYVSDVLSFTVTPLRPPFPLPLPYPELTLGRRKC